MKGVPVLMYHGLEDSDDPAGAKDLGEQLYVLQVRQFREQMEYLHREGFRTFLLEELFAMDEWPEKAVVITFDDGHDSNYTLALPILREFGFRAEFFITTGWIGTPHYMNLDQIRGLFDAGMGIGSHGISHSFFDDMPEGNVEKEMRDSKAQLTEIIDCEVLSISVPGGRTSPSISRLVSALGYRMLCTSSPGMYNLNDSSYTIPRYAVRNSMPLSDFALLVSRDASVIHKIFLRTRALDTAKKLLGNKLYERIRSVLVEGLM